jgi:hypothetical protein
MSKSIVSFQSADQLPAHLVEGSGLGNENVSADNMSIPRLDLIQALSPQLKKSDAKYIKGAELGHMFNTLTGDLFEQCFIMNLFFEMNYTVFKKRTEGGGYEGSFDTQEAAEHHLHENGLDAAKYDIVETAIHKCILLDEQGQPKTPILIYMSGSKLSVSNAWNTAINSYKCDRFGTVWTLSSVEETNKRGQGYQNFKFQVAGMAGPELYQEARSMYFSMKGLEDPMASKTVH